MSGNLPAAENEFGPTGTLQTAEPLQRVAQNNGNEPIMQLLATGRLLFDPPYQRGAVWGTLRRRLLVRSLLRGIPVNKVFINQRPDNTEVVVDGKQRLETCQRLFADAFTVPHSWFPVAEVNATVETADGLYVLFSGLSATGQARITRCSLDVQITWLATVEQEEELFYLLNFSGLPQGQADPDR